MRRMRIGFVGTGLMGGPMIRNLAAAGFEVQIYARDPDKMGTSRGSSPQPCRTPFLGQMPSARS